MRRSLVLLVGLGVLAGCSTNTFVGRRYDNFTSFYNTFYNAQESFQKGEKALVRSDQAVDRMAYLPIFTVPSSGQSAEFDKAIRKSADLLRSHPRSKWVDDAALLIGKSYFYLQNYVGAEQKFREVSALEGPLSDEALFWLARTLVVSEQHEAADDLLQATLEREEVAARWSAQLRFVLAELYVQRGEWEQAAAELERGLEAVRDRDLAARAQFLLGQVYETMGRYEDAGRAYARVQRYRPPYELSYAAQVSEIAALGLHGQDEPALRLLRRMSRDDKHYSNRAELQLLRARILQARGEPDGALALYDELLYDSDQGAAALRGQAHYRLAELFRDAYGDFFLAAAHFDTASTTLRRPGGEEGTDRLPPAAITDAETRARTFKSFVQVADRVLEMDSLLYLGSLDEARFDSAITAIRRARAAEMRAQQELLARRQAEAGFTRANVNDPSGSRAPITASTAGSESSNLGFLFHKDAARVQEGFIDFRTTWGDRPLVPNWRRQQAIATVERAADGDVADGDPAARLRDDPDASLPLIDFSAVPRDSLSRLKLRRERAGARYELGNVLFLSMNRPDSAAAWYRLVIEQDGAEPVAQRAFYALAEVHRALGDSTSAARLYRQIVDADPASDFAVRARERLGLPQPAASVVSDSASLADAAYEQAYRSWQQRRYPVAVTEMLALASTYPNAPSAPRALLAAGLIYTEWARQDSLDLFGPIPIPPEVALPFAQADSAAPPRPGRPADSLAAAPDSLRPMLAADPPAADSLIADSLAAPAVALRLQTLYAEIERRYARTPFARQAAELSKALAERRPAPAPDTTTAAPDSTAAPGTTAAPDSTAAPETAVVPAAPEPEEPVDLGDPLRAGAPLYPDRGGWTWFVASLPSRPAAESMAERYRRDGFRSGVVQAAPGGRTVYRVGIGQFATRQAALDARGQLPERVPADAYVSRINPASVLAATPADSSRARPQPALPDTAVAATGTPPAAAGPAHTPPEDVRAAPLKRTLPPARNRPRPADSTAAGKPVVKE